MGSNSLVRGTAVHRIGVAIAIALMLLTLWALTHRYHGFARDGEIYAMQALARVHPALAADLYLQNTSQDHYTVFSPLYAAFIRISGLQTAELGLFCVFTAWFFVAAWLLTRQFAKADEAWLSLALLVVTAGYYGSDEIFSYSENYLTARTWGEALVVTALTSHFSGRRVAAFGIAALALLVHPLMALPGALLLIFLWLPLRLGLSAAVAGVLTTLAFALTANTLAPSSGLATVMDPAWIEVVRERSQFLLLNYWHTADWETAARPFVCLTLTALALPDARVRKLCICAMLVGGCGLAVAAIAGSLGPVAILLQGQAWRWVWLTTLVSVLLLGPALAHIWTDPRCGPLCAMLLALGWTYAAVDELACVDAALLLWLLRPYVSTVTARHLRWAAGAVGVVMLCWLLANCWTLISAPIAASGREPVMVGRLREIFGLALAGLLFTQLFTLGIRRLRATWAVYLVCAALSGAAIWILPGTIRQMDTVGTAAEIREFEDWRTAIPPSSNVLMVPPGMSAAFPWFTLGRPSYLSVGQSAGVVFSRATSLEVRRRSDVLLPLVDPDWKILTSILHPRPKQAQTGSTAAAETAAKPLTAAILIQICADPELGFVIAKENVGFDPLRHPHAGSHKDWNLYDCRKVSRAGSPG